LHHTSAKSDYQFPVATLVVFKSAHVAENPVLCVFADCTGVKQNQVSIFVIVRHFKTHSAKHTSYTLAVADISLTAVGTHVGKGLFPDKNLIEFLPDRFRIFKLNFHLFGWNQNLFLVCFQKTYLLALLYNSTLYYFSIIYSRKNLTKIHIFLMFFISFIPLWLLLPIIFISILCPPFMI